MRQSRFTNSQILAFLQQNEEGARSVPRARDIFFVYELNNHSELTKNIHTRNIK